MKHLLISVCLLTLGFSPLRAQQTRAEVLQQLNQLVQHAAGEHFNNWGDEVLICRQELTPEKVIICLQDRTSRYTSIPWNDITAISITKATGNNKLAKLEFNFGGDNTVSYENLYASNDAIKATQHKGLHIFFLEKDREQVAGCLKLLKALKN